MSSDPLTLNVRQSSLVIAILSSINCSFTSWLIPSPWFSVLVLQMFQLGALKLEHETQLFSLWVLWRLGTVLWVGRMYQLIQAVCVPVIKLRQWDCFIFLMKFVVGFINFLCTFVRTGGLTNWIKFWISIFHETVVLVFVLLVTW